MTRGKTRNTFRTTILTGTAMLALAAPTLTAAQTAQPIPTGAQKTYPFDIPEQALEVSLRVFARATHGSILFDRALVKGKRAVAVKGDLRADDVLERLLAGSGLHPTRGARGAYVIERDVTTTAAESEPKQRTHGADDIVVTGTRLAPQFAGATPTQVVSQKRAAESGLLDSADVLRTQPQVSGPRSQLRYGSEDLGGNDNGGGPGTQTIALRGFSAAQTLVLLNGRRIPAGGVEGVPRSPDISLVPVDLVDQYEILTDGASPVFGTDAIAGIVNIKLRQNIDRPTLYMALQQRQNGGEPTALLSFATGKTFDHGFFGFGAEYRRTGGLKYRDAKFFGLDCSAVFDRDSSGKIRDIDLLSAQLPGTSLSPCIDFNTKQTGILNTAGGYSYYSTPGRSNVGVPNFSVQPVTQDVALANPQFGWKQYDTDGNGRLDGPGVDKYGSPTSGDLYFADPNNTGKNAFDFKSPAYDYQQGTRADNAYAIAPIKQLSLFAYGQRDTGFAGDATLYFEASFNQRKTAIRSLGFTINPYIVKDVVPVTNPTNPCGFEVGRCLSSDGLKYQEVAPFLKLAGDGDYVTSKLDQYRLVVGARGALNFLNGFGPGWLALQDWKYDLSLNYGRTVGSSHRRAVLRDRLETSLSTTVRDPSTGKLICGVDNNGDGFPDDPSTCVPVNLFTEAAQTRGELTAAENDYLFGSLDYRTSVSLLVLQGTVTGSLFKLPGGAVSVVMGGEYRRDGIDSSGNEDARTQNFASYSRFIDPGAKGSRSVYDVFGELGIPIIRDKPFFHNLNLSVAARATHEQYTGTNETWSVRGRYEPLSWLAIRGTYGTSFRSPNTYELFIQPVVNSRPFGEDPCIVPFNAFDSVNGYIPANDYRSKITLDRCRGSGVDPMTLGGNAFTIPNGKELQGGSTTDLRPETSKALSAGFVMTLDDRVLPHRGVFKGVKLNLGATYYEIKVINQLQQGYSYAILNGCYGDQGVQQYCGRITRGSDGYISSLTTGFINGTPRGTKGVDFNLLVQKDTTIGNRPLSVALTIAGNYEFRVREGSGYGELDLSGIFEYPKLKMNSALQVHSGDLLATWYINYVGGAKALFQPSSDFARTCLPSESITCTPISTIPSYLLNNASLAWKKGDVVISAGLNNVFNVQPPRISNLVDTTGRTNTLLNGNYDLMRRTFVLQVRKAF